MADVTQILSHIEQGDLSAADKLLPLVYDELRKLAAARLARERPGNTLQATALVHDAYMRLVDVERAQHWKSRGHFFAAAAEAMRRILIESARRKATRKRGGGQVGPLLDKPVADVADVRDPDVLLDLNEALDRLEREDPVAAQLVKLRYFAGLTNEQAAEVLQVSVRNVYYVWAYARSWLRRALRGHDSDHDSHQGSDQASKPAVGRPDEPTDGRREDPRAGCT